MEAYKKKYYKEYYTEGSAARKLQVIPDYERENENGSKVVAQPKKVPSVSRGIDFISMSLLVIALAITLFLCYNYLKVQGNIIQLERDIMNEEQKLNEAKSANDALEEGLLQETDWNKIYKIAVSELHMVYPNKNEVISYQGSEDGYVIQHKSIPE